MPEKEKPPAMPVDIYFKQNIWEKLKKEIALAADGLSAFLSNRSVRQVKMLIMGTCIYIKSRDELDEKYLIHLLRKYLAV